MTTHKVCNFGVHKGESYRQVPASFLVWMMSVEHPQAEIAKEELKRREHAAMQSVHSKLA